MQRLIALAGGTWGVFLQAMSAFTLHGGTKALVEAMHAETRASTRLNTPVARLESTGGQVIATTGDGRAFTARTAVVTVPLNVLTTAIEFVPPLSAPKRAAVEAGQVSRGVKVWMRARGRIAPFIAFAPAPNPLCMLGYEYDVDGDTILLGFGPDADQLDVADLTQVQDAVNLWRPDIELVAVDAQDWTHDPFAGETWAMFGPGYLSEHAEAFLAPEGDVWIAGGDYSQGWAGHIDGAIESGRRAAGHVRTALEAR